MEEGTKFWGRVDPGTVVTVLGGVAVAALGLLGPASAYVANQAQGELARTEQQHQQLMDFADKLIASEKIVDERERTYYRRDVMRFFAVALAPGAVREFAQEEAGLLEERAAKLRTLAEKEGALAETERAVAEATEKAEAVAEIESTKAAVRDPEAAESLRTLSALSKKEAEVAASFASERLETKGHTAKQVSELRAELGLRQQQIPMDAVRNFTVPCRSLSVSPSSDSVSDAQARNACLAADTGLPSWTARVDGHYVRCRCGER